MNGDGYSVADVSWAQLTIHTRNHEHLARNAAHIWVLELAYCGDSNLKDLRRVWKKNLRVCYFFEYCLGSNLRPFERSFSFERTCFSNKILIPLCTLLGPAADHNYAIRRREGRPLCGKCYAGRRFTVFEEVFGTTEHWYIPSVHNLGLWNPLKRRYLGCHRRRTRTGDASRLGKTPVCKGARGCASKPLLQVPRHHAIICVLHMLMRIGALLGEYLERLCLSASREARNVINNMLKIALCGWQLGGTCRPDGQETKRFFLYGMVLLMFWGWLRGTWVTRLS